MVWTKKKPVVSGYYWLKMEETLVTTEQQARVVFVDGADGILFVLEAPEYDPRMTLAEASDKYLWSSEPIEIPASS